MWAEQMQKYKVSMEWKSGFKTTHYHHGSEKSVLAERVFLDGLQYLSKYIIKEVKFKGWQIMALELLKLFAFVLVGVFVIIKLDEVAYHLECIKKKLK